MGLEYEMRVTLVDVDGNKEQRLGPPSCMLCALPIYATLEGLRTLLENDQPVQMQDI